MKILITGSTGLVGNTLVNDLQSSGHTVCRLLRPGTETRNLTNSSAGFDVNWDPVTGGLGGAAVGADAVVNLSGAPIANGRWTPERKNLLRTSRVDSTRALVNALARMNASPGSGVRFGHRDLWQSWRRAPDRRQHPGQQFPERLSGGLGSRGSQSRRFGHPSGVDSLRHHSRKTRWRFAADAARISVRSGGQNRLR